MGDCFATKGTCKNKGLKRCYSSKNSLAGRPLHSATASLKLFIFSSATGRKNMAGDFALFLSITAVSIVYGIK